MTHFICTGKMTAGSICTASDKRGHQRVSEELGPSPPRAWHGDTPVSPELQAAKSVASSFHTEQPVGVNGTSQMKPWKHHALRNEDSLHHS